jgi:hypothetical protein
MWYGDALHIILLASEFDIECVRWVFLALREVGLESICQISDRGIPYMLRCVNQVAAGLRNVALVDEPFS